MSYLLLRSVLSLLISVWIYEFILWLSFSFYLQLVKLCYYACAIKTVTVFSWIDLTIMKYFSLLIEMLSAFLNQGKCLILLHVKLWYLWQWFKIWVVTPNTYVTLKVFSRSFPPDKDSISLFQTFPTLATMDGIPAIIYLILRTITS